MILKFDIWLAEVPFEDIDESKERPVLILDHVRKEVFCLRMTSKNPQTSTDFEVLRWQKAGLKKPTVINTARRLKLSDDKLILKIGSLHDDDRIILQIRHGII